MEQQLKEKIEVDLHKMKQKRRTGKVIRSFRVEIFDASFAPEVYVNPNNPYAQLSEEERLKEFVEIFGLLWAESNREISKDIYGNKKLATSNKNDIIIPIRK